MCTVSRSQYYVKCIETAGIKNTLLVDLLITKCNPFTEVSPHIKHAIFEICHMLSKHHFCLAYICSAQSNRNLLHQIMDVPLLCYVIFVQVVLILWKTDYWVMDHKPPLHLQEIPLTKIVDCISYPLLKGSQLGAFAHRL